ncbi:MAG: L,D-transpeptidase, partial [Succinivibrionaceae bacterium]
EPVKITTEPNGGIYIEVHQPLSTTEEQINSTLYSPIHLNDNIKLFLQENANVIDTSILNDVNNDRSGIPVMLNPIRFY